MSDHEQFEIQSMTPQEVLGSMVEELHLGSCLLPFPDEFIDMLKAQGEVDPDTSQQYFFMRLKKMDDTTELTLLTVLEAMQLHDSVHTYIKNMIESINDQMEDE